MVVSILTKVIGFPDQVRLNYKRKSVEGLSKPFFILGFTSYVLWTAYGLAKSDPVLMIGQGIGVFLSGIIGGQMIYYSTYVQQQDEIPDWLNVVDWSRVRHMDYSEPTLI